MRAVYLCGPTAVGKSALALEIARRINGEIISVDSMQVYRGMEIGTAKPSRLEQETTAHHLIDVADLTETFNAGRFMVLAGAAQAEIAARGRIPIFCGGTGLYFSAHLLGLGSAPSDPAIRAELQSLPLSSLLDELQRRDPVAWEKIDRQNPRRVIRAVEIIRMTGQPYSEQRVEWKMPLDAKLIGLEMSQRDLQERIGRRVDAMFKGGLVEETGHLIKRGLRDNPTASQALGYKQALEHLEGKASIAETIELVKLRTRQFAKRQYTWFRRQLPVDWISVDAGTDASDLAKRIVQAPEFSRG